MYHAVTHHATGHHGTSLLMTPQINIYEPLQYIFSAGLCLKQQGLTHSDKVYQVYFDSTSLIIHSVVSPLLMLLTSFMSHCSDRHLKNTFV